MLINLVNLKSAKTMKRNVSNFIRIGRGSVFGNPFKISKTQSREMVIERYRKLLWNDYRRNGRITRACLDLIRKHNFGTVTLACYCHPKPCHGDVLKSFIIWLAGAQVEPYTFHYYNTPVRIERSS